MQRIVFYEADEQKVENCYHVDVGIFSQRISCDKDLMSLIYVFHNISENTPNAQTAYFTFDLVPFNCCSISDKTFYDLNTGTLALQQQQEKKNQDILAKEKK